jgi:hypothetical protein
MARYDYALTTADLTRLRVRTPTHFRVWTTLSMSFKDANFHTNLDLASSFWQVRVRDEDVHKSAFRTLYRLVEWVVLIHVHTE